jgi:cytochrome c
MRARLVMALLPLVPVACGGTDDAAASVRTPDEKAAGRARYSLGTPVSNARIDSLDLDVNAVGRGLPPGQGDARRGEALFKTQCAACHGARGQGMEPVYPALIGREPRDGFPFSTDFRIVKTIGNYWPYATTLFDYIRRAMPFTAPGSLTADEVYSLTAYLLAANEVIPAGATLDSASLMAVRMPARDRFVRDDRRGGPEIR